MRELGFSDELLAKVSGYNPAAFDEILTDLDKLGNHLQKNKIKLDNFESTIKILTGNNANYRQGVHWIIQDIGTESSFAGKTLKMEMAVDNARETFSFIDLVCEKCSRLGTDILIEYKSGSGSITKETIKKQFIERDLFKINSLEELQWRTKNTNMSKEKLVDWLTENKTVLENLEYEKINKLFNTKFDEFTPKSNLSNAVIDHFSNTSNYNKIFK